MTEHVLVSRPSVRWTRLWTPEKGYHPRVRAAAMGEHGVYALREGKTVHYVGESHTGRLWKTLLRHFQGLSSGKFEKRSEWVWSARDAIEVQLWITRTPAGALDLEDRVINAYRPTNESLSLIPDFDVIMGRREDEPAPF